MKKIRLETVKFMELSVKEDKQYLLIGKDRFEIREWKLIERIQKEIPFMEHREIADKYEKDSKGMIVNPEDAEKYLWGIKELEDKYSEEEEVIVLYWEEYKNIMWMIEQLLNA
jgi:nicotinic acid mononucleotide adenylyltransferase